jgi:hypothetical protein
LNLGWPADLSWYKLLDDWQTMIAGVLALIAGIAAYRAGRQQANATLQASKEQVAAVNAQLAHLKAEKEESDKRANIDRQQREISQIILAISSIGYNIETLLHIVMQYVIPHHADTYKAYTDLHNAIKDPQQAANFAKTFFPATYPALVTLCPDVHLIEWDFFEKLPFLAEKDPELLRQTHWLISQSRDLATAIKTQNSSTQEALRNTIQEGGLKLSALNSILNLQTSIANAECFTSLQLFELFLSMEKKLETINDTYKIPTKKSKMTTLEPLQAVMDQLREINSSMTVPPSGFTPPAS